MSEQCGSSPTLEEGEAAYERDRQARIDRYYQGESAADMAERIVDLEDELGGETEEGLLTGMHADVAEAQAEIERLTARLAARVADNTAEWTAVRSIQLMNETGQQRDRYRLAWLSARRRAADEWNFGMEALELRDAEIARLRAELADLRESTHGAPRLEHVGTDDGDNVYRLRSS